MKLSQVALQLYTLRDHCKTAADLAVTLRKVRAIGYPAVQISGVGPIPESEIVSMCAGEGLVICATHEKGAVILESPQKVVDRLGLLGCSITAYPYPGGIDFGDRAAVDQLARQLDTAGEVLAAAGQTLCYHNHAIEFVRVPGTRQTALEYLYDRTRAAFLQAEIDTYWVQYGGGDPVLWCHRLAGRLPIIHLKDFGFTKENQIRIAEIGAGNLDFPAIIAAAEASGCRWFVVEQDTCPGDPFESARMSWEYLRDHIAQG